MKINEANWHSAELKIVPRNSIENFSNLIKSKAHAYGSLILSKLKWGDCKFGNG